MQEKFLSKLNIETKLSRAMVEKNFQLYYQPQFYTQSEKLRGFEALLRWYDDELGWISPEQFVPLAEETHLVIPLGNWVLDTALRTLSEWEQRFDFDGIMSVNVSPIQFCQDDFIPKFLHKIDFYKITPRHLEIEITEGVLIENVESVIAKLNEVKNLGIGISLDDFGTGYSSLRYLQMLPLTTLKIDKSFIKNIAMFLMKDLSILSVVSGSICRYRRDEYPVPKSSREIPIPRFFTSLSFAITLSTFSIRTPSVISISRCLGVIL